MDNHHLVFPALQKYYSALKSLDDFGCRGNFFDDVSNLDTFFSEFRNITFVIQKELKTEENKKIYSELRDKHLSGDTLKWFVKTRNKTTKEKPFALKKELKIDIYLPHGVYSLKSEQLLVDFDASFDDALNAIKSIFIEKLQLVEVFFSSQILFSEEGENIDLYPRIKSGIKQMNGFLCEFQKAFTCTCETCSTINELIEKTYKNVMFKELKFVNDYTLEKELVEGERAEMFISAEGSNYSHISDIRTTLDNPLYKDVQGCYVELFKRFASCHVAIYQMQDNDIMPVFMIVYSDNTFRTIPFAATTKATCYRKVQEVINASDFLDAIAVFFCGEFYAYDIGQFAEINQKPYSERTSLAKEELLSFTMLTRGGGEMTILIDTSRIDDMKYIAKQIHAADWEKEVSPADFDWLNPIREKLKS